MLQIILHRVCKPGGLSYQFFLCCSDASEPLRKNNGLHVAILFRVSERFIDEKECDIFIAIVLMNRLQTGDVTKKRGGMLDNRRQ